MKLVVISQTFTRVKYQEIIWPLYRHLTKGMTEDTTCKESKQPLLSVQIHSSRRVEPVASSRPRRSK